MRKFFLGIFIFFSSFAYSSEADDPEQNAILQYEYGHDYLLIGQPRDALQHFETAERMLRALETESSEVEVLVLLGKIVAYDNLWMRPECERSVGAFFLKFFEKEEEGEEDDEELSFEEEKMVVDLIQQLASVATSYDVRHLLLTFVEILQHLEE